MTVLHKKPIIAGSPVADIAINFPHSIKILNRYEVDYCCDGNKTFKQACDKAKVDHVQVWSEIQEELKFPASRRRNFIDWDESILMDFIMQTHHEFIRISVPEIRDLISMTSAATIERAELPDLLSTFNYLADALTEHIREQEEIIFPSIRRITSNTLSARNTVLLKHIQKSITTTTKADRSVCHLLKMVRTLTSYYNPGHNASPTLQALFKILQELDEDVIQHLHIENNVLFRKYSSSNNLL